MRGFMGAFDEGSLMRIVSCGLVLGMCYKSSPSKLNEHKKDCFFYWV